MSRAGEIAADRQTLRSAGRPTLIDLITKYRLSINIIQYPDGADDALRQAIEGQLKAMLTRSLEEEQSAPPPKSGHGLIRVLVLTVVGVTIASLVYIFV